MINIYYFMIFVLLIIIFIFNNLNTDTILDMKNLIILLGFLLVFIFYKYSKTLEYETFSHDSGNNFNKEGFQLEDSINPQITQSNQNPGSSGSWRQSYGSYRSGRHSPDRHSHGPSRNTPTNNTPSKNKSPRRHVSSNSVSLNVPSLPYAQNLLLYFNSFNISSSIPTNIQIPIQLNNTYQCQTNYWCDANNSSIKYFLSGQNVPATIDNNGLPLKNIKIIGPPASTLVSSANNYILQSFTIAFYLNMTTLNFDTNGQIMLYQMNAENPNAISLFIQQIKNDTNNVEICAQCGNSGNYYTWIVPITTILSNGNTTLYSLVYDHDASTLTLYIGIGRNAYSVTMPDTETKTNIVLTNTQITINTNSNLDANILAFAYYNIALSRNDMKQLNYYFEQQASNNQYYNELINYLQATLTQENALLLNQLNQATSSISNLQSEITQLQQIEQAGCPATISAPSPAALPWQISMAGVSSVNDQDLQQCSPLTLKEFDIALPSVNMPNIQKLANAATTIIKNPPPLSLPKAAPQPSAPPSAPPVPTYTTPAFNTPSFGPTYGPSFNTQSTGFSPSFGGPSAPQPSAPQPSTPQPSTQ